MGLNKKIDKSTCWYNKVSFKEMVNAVKSHLPLDKIEHGKVLIELLFYIDNKDSNLLDLSCGGGHLSTIIKGKYTGSDLKHVIENVSKKCYPDSKYTYLDIIQDDLTYINSYDIIVLNAIIDVMEYPLEILDKVLKNCNKYVIIHRQEIIEDKYSYDGFSLTKQESYGGFTFHTIIEKCVFNCVLRDNNFSIIKELNSGLGLPNNKSFLLKKDDIR